MLLDYIQLFKENSLILIFIVLKDSSLDQVIKDEKVNAVIELIKSKIRQIKHHQV